MTLGLGQEIYRVNLIVHLIACGSKEALRKTHSDGDMPKDKIERALNKIERAPNTQSWNNLFNKINNIILIYNPKCKINIYESMPICIND